MPAENRGGTINRYIDSAILDNSSVVLKSYEPLNRQSIGSATVGQPTFITSHGCSTPSQKETEADSMQTIWTSLVQRGVSNEAADIIMQPGQIPPSNNTTVTSKPGLSCAANGISIHMIHL